MPNPILQLFQPPVYPGDPEKTRVARVLNALILGIGGVALVFLTIGVPFIFSQHRIITGSLCGALFFSSLLAWILMRQNWIKAASLVLIVILHLIVNADTYLGGGFESKGSLLYGLLIVPPFLLLEFRGAILSTLAATLSIGFFSYLGWAGVVIPRVLPGLPLGMGLTCIGVIWIIYMSASISRQGWQESRDKARRELELRIESEAEKDRLKEQLFQSRKMESLGRMAGGLTHDFINLLSVITIHLQILRRQRAEDEFLVSEINKVEETVQSAVNMTRNLLNFAKTSELRLENVELDQLIRESQPVLTHLLGGKGMLETSLGASGVRVMADRAGMEQVFQNLVVNARDALAPDGRISIQTAATEIKKTFVEMAPGSYFLLQIRDNGTGMTPETKDKIFEPFFTTKPQGTGLGLATVFGVVRRHKGFIEVDSEQGKGTEFRIYLPVAS